MRFSARHSLEEETPLPMAALVDIIFLLLIFFVSTSVFYRLEAEIDIMIPYAAEASIDPYRNPDEIIVNVRKNGTLTVNQREMTLNELGSVLDRITAVQRGRSVIVRGDAETVYQNIMSVFDICANAGISNVKLAAMNEPLTNPQN